LFYENHPWVNIEAFLRPCKVGILKTDNANPRRTQLRSKQTVTFQEASLSEITIYNYNTKIFKFSVDVPLKKIELGSHLKIQHTLNGNIITRPYTPIQHTNYSFDLLIKAYPQGLLTPHLHKLRIGDTITFSILQAEFQIPPNKEHIGLICGGTGITPMISILHSYLPNPQILSITLLYSNRKVEDILLKERLDHWQEKYTSKFKVHYTLTQAEGASWTGLTGRIDKEMIHNSLPSPLPTTYLITCGAIEMTNHLSQILSTSGYKEDMIYAFV